jgi:glycyl-tRNA synthetase beta chain
MDRLREPAEIQLRAAMQRMGTDIKTALEERAPARALTAIASIQPELARFFEEVRVMVDDPTLQEARLALLAEVRDRTRAQAGVRHANGRSGQNRAPGKIECLPLR